MFALAIALTVVLLLETLPSAVADLSRSSAGMTRLDQLTRLGLPEGRNLRVVSALGVLHLAGSAAVLIGLWRPAIGVAGAALEIVLFAWVVFRQLSHGDRGRALFAYVLFTTMATAVLITDAVRW